MDFNSRHMHKRAVWPLLPAQRTSSKTTSAGMREKAKKAAHVVDSKKVMSSPAFTASISSRSSVRLASLISALPLRLPKRIRSWKQTKCGDV
eukprot:4090539-Pleurochrysis_carterae.AAC.2